MDREKATPATKFLTRSGKEGAEKRGYVQKAKKTSEDASGSEVFEVSVEGNQRKTKGGLCARASYRARANSSGSM